MFRKRQNFEPSGSSAILLMSDKVLPDGCVERELVDVGKVVLPPPENYDLGVLLKAGVPLQEVNCKLISSNVVPDIFKDESNKKTSDESVNDKEN